MNQDLDDKNMIKVIDSLRADIKNKFSIKKLHEFEEKMRNQYGFNDIQKKIYAIYDAQMHRFLNNESWELTQDEAVELATYRKNLNRLINYNLEELKLIKRNLRQDIIFFILY